MDEAGGVGKDQVEMADDLRPCQIEFTDVNVHKLR